MCRGAFVDVYVDDVLYLTHTYAPELMATAGGAGVFYVGQPKTGAVPYACVRRFKELVMASESGVHR